MNEDVARAYRSLFGPSWRWELALLRQRTSSTLGSDFRAPEPRDDNQPQERQIDDEVAGKHIDDALVDLAISFIQALMSEDQEDQNAAQFVTISAAKSIWDDPSFQETFVTLVLGNCSEEVISRRLGIDTAVARCAEHIFFDARPMLAATDWIDGHVIRPTVRDGVQSRATKYRAALWGGPIVAEEVLNVACRVAWDEVQSIADQEHKLAMKAQEALDIPLSSPAAALRMLEIKLQLDHQTQSLKLRKEQFRHRREQDIRQHQLTERRLDVSRQRGEQRQQAERDRMARREEQERAKQEADQLLWERRHQQMLDLQQAARQRAEDSPLVQLLWSTERSDHKPTCQQKQAHEQEQCVALLEATGENQEVILESLVVAMASS